MPPRLFPTCSAYHTGYLQVSPLHRLWYGQYGNPNGMPVVVLHGGPGAGCDAHTVRLFDPAFWRIILLDQRGSGRSTPWAELTDNTTADLIADLVCLKDALSIDQWLVFGGSWGSALALAYGQSYPHHILGFILRGIFLAQQEETANLWFGIQRIFPDRWQAFCDHIPPAEQQDLIGAYYQRILSPDHKIAMRAARAFAIYDFTCSYLNLSENKLKKSLSNDRFVLGLARIYMHYCVHDFFLKPRELIDKITFINHLPLIIVHGRYDLITLPQSAYALHQRWPDSELVFVNSAGHSAKERAIARRLMQATECMKTRVRMRTTI